MNLKIRLPLCRSIALFFLATGTPFSLSQTYEDLEWKIQELESRIDELESFGSRPPADCTPPVGFADVEICNQRAKLGEMLQRQQNECYDAIEKSIVGEPNENVSLKKYRECTSLYELPDERLIPAMQYQKQKKDHFDAWLRYSKSFQKYHECELALFCWNDEEAHSRFRDTDFKPYTEFPSYQTWRNK